MHKTEVDTPMCARTLPLINTSVAVNANASASTDNPLAAPAAPDSYEAVRFNAMRHGILSRYVVLSHENGDDYQSLIGALFEEHMPAGATEQHLIEELAGVIWRKRRVLQAEGATINKGLRESARSGKTVIPAAAPFEIGLSGECTDIRDLMDLSPPEVADAHKVSLRNSEAVRKASAILSRAGANAYERALRALRSESREMWEEYVQEEEFPADAEGLASFIDEHIEPQCRQQEKEAQHHDAIRNQTIGEGLQAFKLEKLSRYETHLDRKFERTLGMLLKLKELRNS